MTELTIKEVPGDTYRHKLTGEHVLVLSGLPCVDEDRKVHPYKLLVRGRDYKRHMVFPFELEKVRSFKK